MIKTYKIEVDCAACADKMERAAEKTEGVLSASVNFMALLMTIELSDEKDEEAVMKNVLKNCRRVERDCMIYF